jgi:hypothetical protein
VSVSARLGVVAVFSSLTMTLSVAPAQAAPLATSLTGANEVPGPGDADGSGTFVAKIKPGRGTLCYTLTVSNIDPAFAAHVHIGAAGVAGPIVITLAAPTDGSVTACATAERELLMTIARNPEGYYVNVHNATFPAGAVRGQLG